MLADIVVSASNGGIPVALVPPSLTSNVDSATVLHYDGHASYHADYVVQQEDDEPDTDDDLPDLVLEGALLPAPPTRRRRCIASNSLRNCASWR